MNAETRLARGASWFYWVAGLSLLNAVLFAFGQEWRLVMGLGLTDLLCALPKIITGSSEMGTAEMTFVVTGNVIVAAFVALFGFLSLRRQTWAFILGALLYAADTLLLFMVQDWYSIAFHAYVLYRFFDGIKACFDLKKPPAPTQGEA